MLRIFKSLGTPNKEVWPGVELLPDYNTQFPRNYFPPSVYNMNLTKKKPMNIAWKKGDLKKFFEKKYPKTYLELPDSAYNLLNVKTKKNCILPIFFVC